MYAFFQEVNSGFRMGVLTKGDSEFGHTERIGFFSSSESGAFHLVLGTEL